MHTLNISEVSAVHLS